MRAALRNLAIGAIHLLGRRDITETTPLDHPPHAPRLDLLHPNHT